MGSNVVQNKKSIKLIKPNSCFFQKDQYNKFLTQWTKIEWEEKNEKGKEKGRGERRMKTC